MIKVRRIIVILLAFMITSVFNPFNIKADVENKVDVNITALINADDDNEGSSVVLYNGNVNYGSTFEPDFTGVPNNVDFMFWIINGHIDLNLEMEAEFVATTNLNAIAIFVGSNYLNVYIDHSGKLLASKMFDAFDPYDEDDITKPTKVGYEFNEWLEVHQTPGVAVKKATYTLNHMDVKVNTIDHT